MKTTELNLIPIFVAIYEEKNISRAAKRLSLSQPAVSKGLKRLREVYNEPLFHRNNHGVEPTSFAMDIYPAFEAALANYRSTLSTSRQFDALESNKTFFIACISAIGFDWFNQLAILLKEIAPSISFEVHPLFTQDYEADLRLQRYDLVIDIEPFQRTLLKSEVLSREEACVVYAHDHPRLQNEVSVEEFFHEKHVVLSRWQVRDCLLNDEHIQRLSERKVSHSMPTAADMLSLVSCTEDIAILARSVVEFYQPLYPVNVAKLPFDTNYFDICALWHPSRNSDTSHQWLRSQLKEAIKISQQNK
ncbi:MAG: LysR family transcriptional regulator [Vibrio sp.]